MNIITRNNVKISGAGEEVLMLSHGYGCSQKMWSLVLPELEKTHRVVLFDHIGSGASEVAYYDKVKYGSLNGYAEDVIEVIQELGIGPVTFVGHSVSAMIGVSAANKRPDLFRGLVLVTPSPCYVNTGDYVGGFTRDAIEGLIHSLEANFAEWARAIAPVLTGNDSQQGQVLAESFCQIRPDIAKHFARVTFTSDSRSELPKIDLPVLILQCTDDVIAPEGVGSYVHRQIKGSRLVKLMCTGHCPHLTAPKEFVEALRLHLPLSL